MIEKASSLSIKFIACTININIKGIEKEELFVFVGYDGMLS
ncbi:MAG: hypothetical protein RR533_07115 [Carnobacterium sp.]